MAFRWSQIRFRTERNVVRDAIRAMSVAEQRAFIVIPLVAREREKCT